MGCVLEKFKSHNDRRSVGGGSSHGSDDGAAVTARKGKEEVEPERRTTCTRLESWRRPPPLTQDGWPPWLVAVAGDAIRDWTPRRVNSFEKLDKIGHGTYSNVFKARDLVTGKIVALKKVRFDNLEPESVNFMAREILVLSKLDHPNVIKLEGLATSRMSSSLYLIFEYMEHDLAGLAAFNKTEPQVKCYMKQLLSGLEHCHSRGVLHRDIKSSNLLVNDEGILKIADFGLATFFNPDHKRPMTSRVVTLWYRPPELLLGAVYYGVGVDLWSAGCILAELLAGKPILPGRTEVEQLHKIFKLCGTPNEEFWKKSELPAVLKPQQSYKRCIAETFKDFPPSSIPLIETLLSVDPDARGTATAALNSQFLTTEPYACEPSTLPKYPPTKEIDVKLRQEEARRKNDLESKPNVVRRVKAHGRSNQPIPAPEANANAETQANLNRRIVITQRNAKSKSSKFPPPHQDGAVGHPLDTLHKDKSPLSFGMAESSFRSSVLRSKSCRPAKSAGPPDDDGSPSGRRKTDEIDLQRAPSRSFIRRMKTFSVRAINGHAN